MSTISFLVTKMASFSKILKVHFVAWFRLMGMLFVVVFLAWLFGTIVNSVFDLSIDTSRALRLSFWFIVLGVILPFITAKLCPRVFDIES